MVSPLDRSHSRAVASDEAVTRYAASTEKTQSHTHLRRMKSRRQGRLEYAAVRKTVPQRPKRGETSSHRVWPVSVRSSWKLLSRFHSLTVLSLLVVASCWQSGLMRHLRM